jgi:PUA-domain protein
MFMRIKHRTILRTKELRELLKEVEQKPNLIHRALREVSLGKVPVERILLDDKSELFLIHDELWLVKLQVAMFPGLPALLADNVQLPQVVVDMGAVSHIANGADVMAPGIFSLDEKLMIDDLAVIIDQKNLVPLAVGRMLLPPTVILETNKGRAIETLHYVGDQLWKLAKELSG